MVENAIQDKYDTYDTIRYFMESGKATQNVIKKYETSVIISLSKEAIEMDNAKKHTKNFHWIVR